jgi:pilus assembly protein CpaC
MHRTSRVPRPLAWGLLIALLLSLGTLTAAAQEQLPPPAGGVAPESRTEVLGINQTRRIGMTTKAPIVDIQNENPTVVRIDKVDKDPTTVFVTGVSRGTARLIFTDVNKKTEQIVVRTDDSEQRRLDLLDLIRQVAPTAVVRVNVAPNNTVILTGDVTDVDTAQRIMEAARAVFTIRDGSVVIPAVIFNGMRVAGVQQVQLEVVVAVVNRSLLRQMNFSFVVNGTRYVFNSVLNNPLAFANTLATGVTSATGNLNSSPNITFGVMGNKDSFTGYLGALNTEGLAKILADSRVTTLSGRPAFIVSGGEVPILTSAGIGAPSVSYKQFGTVVNFLPIVQNGKIHLEVRPEVSAINQANGITIPGTVPTVVPGFSTRSAQVAVELEDGQTLAIGGLIQSTINATIQRVPILGHIPGINIFFSNKSYDEIEEELLILVTPRLVDGIACTQIPKYLPGRETRSPDDFELFLEGILEAPRGPRFVGAHLQGYRGAHTLSPNYGLYPCNGVGGAAGRGCTGPGCGSGASAGPAPATPTATPEAMPSAISTPLPSDLSSGVPQPLPVGTPATDSPVPASHDLPAVPMPPRSQEPRPLPPVTFGPTTGGPSEDR